MNVMILSNITTEPFFETAMSKCFLYHKKVTYKSISFEEVYYESNKALLLSADYIIVLLNFFEYTEFNQEYITNKNLYNNFRDKIIKYTLKTYDYLKYHCKGCIIWFGYEGYENKLKYACGHTYLLDKFIDDVNVIVSKHIFENNVYIDLKGIIAQIGINNAYSTKNKYRWNSKYSEELWEQIAVEIHKQHLINNGITKKCIVLDCDNVLWGGILSEVGIEGIHLGNGCLGKEYQDFQCFLLNLYYHGVILTICSKNDEADVMRMFREHSGMLLKEEHISCFKVNWNDKPTNIKMIADELNIGTDSMVFVDDSLFEIEAVKAVLPNVVTIQYDREFMYDKFSCFNLKRENGLYLCR